MQNLDRASRWALRWMAIRICALIPIWLMPWLMGQIPFERVLIILSLVFTASSMIAMFAALLRREKLGAPSLNTWDEAVAFSGLAALAHSVHSVVS